MLTSTSLLSKSMRAQAISFANSSSPSLAGSKRAAAASHNTSSKRRLRRSDSDVEIVQGPTPVKGKDDDDEIMITGFISPTKPGSSSQPDSKSIDHRAVVQHFRLSPKKLG